MNTPAKRLIGLTLALVCLGGALLMGLTAGGRSVTVCQYLYSDGSRHIVIDQDGGPIVMRDLSEAGTLFDGLERGDRVLVRHDGIAASYPARSRAYWCLRLGGGSPDDLPQNTLDQLSRLGWLPENF